MIQEELQYPENYNPFRSIPRKKLDIAIADVVKKFSDSAGGEGGGGGGFTPKGAKLLEAFQRYYDANIPVDYWYRDMNNFTGSTALLDEYNKITKDVEESYKNGVKVCFAGNHGCGKTFISSCILKRVVENGKFSALYVNLTDVVSLLLTDEKIQARKLLLAVDFLVIDEFDQRFMGSENASDLFGRIIEPIIRARIQNLQPLIMCTNSPNVVGSFSGALKASIKSLMKLIRIIPVIDPEGRDHRDLENK